MADDAKPAAKTFDLGEFLAGRSYPEKTVNIYLDEAAGLAINETNEQLNVLSGLGRADEYDEREKKLQELIVSLDERKMQVTVRGVPRKLVKDIIAKINADYPPKKDMLGREESNAEADEALTNLLWSAQIVKIVSPDGAVITPSEADIEALRDLAPSADLRAIQRAIDEVNSASDGFEVAARSVDFLSKP